MKEKPLFTDTPIGPIMLPESHARAARVLSDEALCKALNSEAFVDPAKYAVAMKERPDIIYNMRINRWQTKTQFAEWDRNTPSGLQLLITKMIEGF